MNREVFQTIVTSIPHQPGCYKYFDESKHLLYVGKAKDLRKRISSYFNKTVDSFKTRRLVSIIHSIEFTITDSEHDAFLLENSLIKHYQPKFNISLKDDKTYPYVVIKKERFPRVFFTRKVIRDGSEYLGPYTGVFRARELMEIIKQSIPLRNCTLNLSKENIEKGKFKVCLEYHLGNCNGPCQGFQTEENYNQDLQQVRHILKGNTAEVIRHLKQQMNDCAVNLEFEKAAILKQKIASLQQYEVRSTVVNPHLGDLDVASILSDENLSFVNYLRVINGSVVYAKTLKIDKQLEETDEEILSLALARMRETFHSNSPEVIVPFKVYVTEPNTVITIPKIGDKKKLLDLSIKNALLFKDEMRKKSALMLSTPSKEKDLATLEELRTGLHLKELPIHIECFDNSNFQGSFPVAAMVCFRDAQPFKKDYRHFHIKTVEGINDFASMAEIVHRRYKKLIEEEKELPQLVIIDGGKGQLSAAMESVRKLGIENRLTLIGLAKREESIFFAGDKEPIQLPFDNPAHLLIRRIRDEVHRFGITFHRETRSKGTIKNNLEDIPGIGEKTATDLLKAFHSVKNIKTMSERELTKVVGASKARIVFHYFHQDEEESTL
jgi:excinuclease ABC subunit C